MSLKQQKIIFIFSCLFFLYNTGLFSGTPTALFLVDAQQNLRLYSMGNIYSSASPIDSLSNPWSLGWSVNSAVSFCQWPGIISGSKYNYAGFVSPVKKRGAFNLGYLTYSAGSETVEELDGTVKTVEFEKDTLISIGYGFNIGEKLFVGGSAKYLSSTLADTYRATSFLADIGFAFHSLKDNHIFGISLRNIGQKLKYYREKESLPSEIKFGYSYRFKPMPNHKILCGFSYSKVLKSDINTISAGFEYYPGISILSLRGGLIKRGDDFVYTGGLGLSFKGIACDLGYRMVSNQQNAEDTQLRLSINFLFGPHNEYDIAKTFFEKKGMKKKALALWDNILEGENNYFEARRTIRILDKENYYVKNKTYPKFKEEDLRFTKTENFPVIKYDVQLLPDENGNNIYESGEVIGICVNLRNTGPGVAIGVNLVLSGDKTIISLLGRSKKIGNLESGEFKTVVLKSIVPQTIPRKEAVFKVKVFESRGFSPGIFIEKRIALMPKKAKVIRELPLLLPCPIAYQNKRKKAGAVVVGISDYKNVNKLKYARKDAELVAEYINGVVGIPEQNIKGYYDTDATKTIIETAVKKLVKKDYDFIMFYFAGHGYPDPEDVKSGESFIIPFDGNLDLGKDTFISLNERISLLEKSQARNIFVVFDACFSGAGGRTPTQFAMQRGVAIEPKVTSSKAIILSATSGKQPSLEFDKAGHGYFTYYFLLGLKGKADKNNDGWITVPEIYNFVRKKLDESLEGKQTPECLNEIDIKLGKYR